MSVTINGVGSEQWNVRTGNGQHLLLGFQDVRDLLSHVADHADVERVAELLSVLEAGLPAPVTGGMLVDDPLTTPDLITDAPPAPDTWVFGEAAPFGSAAPEDQPEAVTVASTRPGAARTLQEIADGVGTQVLGPNGDVLSVEEIADIRSRHAATLADQAADQAAEPAEEQMPHPSTGEVTEVDQDSAVWRLVNGMEQAASVLLSAAAGYRSRG